MLGGKLMCYAYRESAKGVEEKLSEHLTATASYCLKRWELDALARKVSRLLRLDTATAKDSIVFVALAHDIGKAASIYQEKCSKGLCTSFKGHYLVSAFLLSLALNLSGLEVSKESIKRFLEDQFDELSKEEIIGVMILLPVILHHYHQVRGYKSYSIEGHEEALEFLEEPRIYPECVESLRSSLNTFSFGERIRGLVNVLMNTLENVGKYFESDSYKANEMIVMGFYKDVIERDIKALNRVTLGKCIVEAITGLINLCDGWAASQARRRL